MPTAMAVALVIPLTATGVELLVRVPFPSWPAALSPQQSTPPVASSAHDSRPLVAIAMALVIVPREVERQRCQPSGRYRSRNRSVQRHSVVRPSQFHPSSRHATAATSDRSNRTCRC